MHEVGIVSTECNKAKNLKQNYICQSKNLLRYESFEHALVGLTASEFRAYIETRNNANVHSFENGVHMVSLALMTTCILFNLLELIALTDATIVPDLC
eukprot:scaffold662_cov364-Pavlova_lutheri.AAC.65